MRFRARSLLGLALTTNAACNIDKLRAEFYMVPPATTDGSSDTSSSSGDASTSTGPDDAPDDTNSSSTTSSAASGTDAVTSTTGTGTTGTAAFCGDGHVDRDALEECDEGPDSDACVNCQRSRIIFVNSLMLGGGKINGLTGADAYCRSQALKAQQEFPESPILDATNFKALLASSTESVADRHFYGKGPYRLVNGLKVSDSFAALFSGAPLHNPINVDERSQTVHRNVWTGIDVDGEPYPGITFCGDWKDLYGSANFGNSDEVDSGWIYTGTDLNPDTNCFSERPIYCVEQE